MSSLPRPRAIYLDGGREPVFAFLHAPASASGRDTAVLMTPPFGWDDVCSYRSRRDWAQMLARAGYPTLRMELPGTGDSGGSLDDPGLLPAWIEAVAAAVRFLPGACATSRVASIGIGIGGLVSCAALAGGAPIDDLVLWAVPARGSSLVRELRAFGRMERAKYANGRDSTQQTLPEGAVGAGGFVLPKEAAEALEQLDLLTLPGGERCSGRALMLERAVIAVDSRLREHLQSRVGEVRVAPGEGYGAMMAEPQEARPPLEAFALVEAWLDEASAPVAGARPDAGAQPLAGAHDSAELLVDGVRILETPVSVEQPSGRLFGVLAAPVEGSTHELGAVLLNAGAIRRIGPNRMWVELARRWAARGVATLRLDLEGLGDADGDAARFVDVAELYIPDLVLQVRAALDELAAQGVAQQFVLAGLCSGAYWSFHGALDDERVVSAFMLNPRTLFWDPTVETVRYLRRGLLEPSSWRMIVKGEVRLSRLGEVARQAPRSVTRRALARWRGDGREQDELDVALDRLGSMGKRLVFVFSENEPLYSEFGRQGRLEALEHQANVELDLLPGRDHTLRPAHSQQSAHELLDRALARELQHSEP